MDTEEYEVFKEKLLSSFNIPKEYFEKATALVSTVSDIDNVYFKMFKEAIEGRNLADPLGFPTKSEKEYRSIDDPFEPSIEMKVK